MLFNLDFLSTQLELATDETKFLPVSKLFFVANAIINLQKDHTSVSKEEVMPNAFVSENEDLCCPEEEIELDEKVIGRLQE
jgi:hypothetical protein